MPVAIERGYAGEPLFFPAIKSTRHKIAVTDVASNTVWFACPKCGWRREFSPEAVPPGTRCKQCGDPIVSSPLHDGKTTLPAVGLTLEPVELPPASGVEHVMTRDDADLQLAPAPPPPLPRIVASDVPRGSVQIEIEQDDVVKPPKNASLYWVLTNNVFEFPFRWCALTQWIFSSVSLAVTGVCLGLAVMGFNAAGTSSGGMFGALQGGIFALVGFMFLLFSVSYVTGCFVDITVNTAHNIDKAHDWPNADYREPLNVFGADRLGGDTIGNGGVGIDARPLAVGRSILSVVLSRFRRVVSNFVAGWAGSGFAVFSDIETNF